MGYLLDKKLPVAIRKLHVQENKVEMTRRKSLFRFSQ